MQGKFIPEREIEMQGPDWGRLELGQQSRSQRRGAVGDRGRRSELQARGTAFTGYPGQEEV